MSQILALPGFRRLRSSFFVLLALIPAVVVLRHPISPDWLRPLCHGTWPILAIAAVAATPRYFLGAAGRYWSLFVVALTLATFQAWCYNTGSHPAQNPTLLWGILPQTDAHLYYTQACELLNGQPMSGFHGARHPYPAFLAALLWACGHDFILVTFVTVLLVALATWTAFEVVGNRLGWSAAVIYLSCAIFYIRIYCTGVFMTEQLGILFSLCAAALIIESLFRKGSEKLWLWCAGLFFLAEGLNARPAAYMTLPCLAVTPWMLFTGDRKSRAGVVTLGAAVVALSLSLHIAGDARAVRPPKNASNAWFCIYGALHGGTWVDGLHRAQSLTKQTIRFGFSNFDESRKAGAEATDRLKTECLSEIKRNPALLLHVEWRALRFVWKKNTPFRSDYPRMPSTWFTDLARWLAVLGVLLSCFFAITARKLGRAYADQQRLGWVILAVLTGWVVSLPFAPPWDGETRILAATLPLFYLLPAFTVSGICLFGSKWLPAAMTSAANQKPASVELAAMLAGILFVVVTFAPWLLVRSSARAKKHPVLQAMEQMVGANPPRSIDLASLHCGYRLRVVDPTQSTWLPAISQTDLIKNVPRGSYLPLSPRFKQLPSGSEILTLPYWVLLIIDPAEAGAGKFLPAPAQTGRDVWPPVYFSAGLSVER